MLARLLPVILMSVPLLASCSTPGGRDAAGARTDTAPPPATAEPTKESQAGTTAKKPESGTAQTHEPAPVESPDLAQHDLLQVSNFTGTDTSILGLKLGLTWDEAKAIVEANPELVFDLDEPNSGRFYVNDAGGGEGDPALFYCQWPDGREGMGRMVIYTRAKRFMPPGAARLFDMPSLAEAPADVRAWLGEPDRSVVTLDIGSIGLKLTTHVFERRALEVIDYQASGDPPHVMVALVVPELLERAE